MSRYSKTQWIGGLRWWGALLSVEYDNVAFLDVSEREETAGSWKLLIITVRLLMRSILPSTYQVILVWNRHT